MSAENETPNAAPAPEGKYVYCIIETKEPRSFGPIGIGGRGDEVYTVHRDVLAKMAGKVEFGLKVNWDRERVIGELEEESEEIRNLKEQITSRGAGSTYFARMQLGRLIESALSEKSDAYVREVYDYLRDTAVASRANKPIGDKMIMNAAFLIERDREQEFDAKVKEIAAKYEGKLSFKYTGPWPPYNFVHIRLKLERGEGATEAIR